MEVNGEEERRNRREDEENEVNYSLINSPSSSFHKALQAILKCLGLESPSSLEEDPGTETVEETGFMAKVTGLVRRRPRPPYSTGRPGQIN